MAGLVQEALARLEVTLELGELPGEYCPGRFSLHLPSGPKVAGVAQRVVYRASLPTAVVVVRGGDALRDALNNVYHALDIPFKMCAAGAVSDQKPDIAVELVRDAIHEAAAYRYGTVPSQFGPDILSRADELISASRVSDDDQGRRGHSSFVNRSRSLR
jgi:lipoate-protein ligase A